MVPYWGKRRLLALAGWLVVMVPYWGWAACREAGAGG
jgi:hypothetical protein